MRAQDKPWGKATTVLLDDRIQVDRLSIRKGGYSSNHLHKAKHNTFVVLSGVLEVVLYPDTDTESRVVLSASESMTVRRGILHKFEAKTDCEVVEYYLPANGSAPDPADIVRHSESGLKE